MKLMIFFLVAFAAFVAVMTSGDPEPTERFGGFVPWASRSRRPSSPNLGNLACYDCVNQEGRKFLRPMLSARTYKYCVVFEDSDSFFLFGYPYQSQKVDEAFEKNPNSTKLVFKENDFLRFRPDFPTTATFCRDSDGCNDPHLVVIDNMKRS